MNKQTSQRWIDQIRTMSNAPALLVLHLLISGNGFAATVAERQFSLPANGLTKLELKADDGALTITGTADSDNIVVNATIRVRPTLDEAGFEAFMGDWVQLSLKRHGRAAQLESTLSAMSIADFNPRIDLVIEMPRQLELVLADGKGLLRVTGLQADVDVKDGSGKLILEDIIGNVSIIDGAGGMEINRVTGDVQIQDRTGPVSAKNIEGTIFLNKRSGGVNIDGLNGDLVIESRLRGELTLTNHAGQVIRPD